MRIFSGYSTSNSTTVGILLISTTGFARRCNAWRSKKAHRPLSCSFLKIRSVSSKAQKNSRYSRLLQCLILNIILLFHSIIPTILFISPSDVTMKKSKYSKYFYSEFWDGISSPYCNFKSSCSLYSKELYSDEIIYVTGFVTFLIISWSGATVLGILLST